MHMPRPWWRESEQAYYVQLGKRQYRLGRNAKQAEERFKELLLLDLLPTDPVPRVYTVRELCKLFLRWSRRHNEPATTKWYREFLKSFCRRYGSRKAHQLKPLNVDVWLDRHATWGDATCRSAVISIQRVLNWGVKRKLLKENPLRDVEKPPMQRRERVLDGDEHERIFASIPDEPFRDFVLAMRETGCRPGEVMKLTAENVSADCSLWVISRHKTKKKTGRVRVIYLTPAMQELTRNLIARHPAGPLFRTFRGKKAKKDKGNRAVLGEKQAWTRNAIRCRFRRLRKKLGLKGVVAYIYRHSYTTDALSRGVPAAVLAELQGTSVRMIEKHYGHLTVKADLLRQAAVQAVSPAQARAPASRIPEGTVAGPTP